ncbi:hypothetical protein KM295_04320 [Natronomonas sp. F2-12]|jgi:hypothetical protein|uniref:Uncharacterized protein n=1 Tax=Natronomonas aquatica TaxID=2841590 RepID=A0A9R1D3W2_9EURY|nr:hypothetical protein [Natronomonas aquatica]MCQ4332729.1 hypothetical protein [Natronomonas aquatica]
MLDVLLHTGTEHANLTWIVLSGLLLFIGGLGLGTYRDRIESFVGSTSPSGE